MTENSTSELNIEIRDITSIQPYERNPRLNDKAVDAVAASLKEFGFRQPIVVDTEGVIIAGHTRWKAAQKLGIAKVTVHVATDLTPEQVKDYRNNFFSSDLSFQPVSSRSASSERTLNIVCSRGVVPFLKRGIIAGTKSLIGASFPLRSQRFKYGTK